MSQKRFDSHKLENHWFEEKKEEGKMHESLCKMSRESSKKVVPVGSMTLNQTRYETGCIDDCRCCLPDESKRTNHTRAEVVVIESLDIPTTQHTNPTAYTTKRPAQRTTLPNALLTALHTALITAPLTTLAPTPRTNFLPPLHPATPLSHQPRKPHPQTQYKKNSLLTIPKERKMAYLNKPTITRLTSTSIKNPSPRHLDGEAAASSKEYDTVPISKHLGEAYPLLTPRTRRLPRRERLEQLFINGHVAAWTDSETYGIYASKAIGTTAHPSMDGRHSSYLPPWTLPTSRRPSAKNPPIVTDITTAGIKTITTDDVAAGFVDGLDPAVLKTMFTAIDNNKNDWTALKAALTKYAPAYDKATDEPQPAFAANPHPPPHRPLPNPPPHRPLAPPYQRPPNAPVAQAPLPILCTNCQSSRHPPTAACSVPLAATGATSPNTATLKTKPVAKETPRPTPAHPRP
ncbi:hypothetical protein BC829DRAFT_420882 [Chytridium lagenaria]|nr:hypothetical protein BC829DRAFT_420882 [Chytridium lagenaria]